MIERRSMFDRRQKLSRSTWIRLGALVLLALVLLWFVPYATLYEWFTVAHVIDWVQSARGNPWTLPLFYLIFSVAVMVLPITLFPIVGGVLFGFWLALPLNLLAATVGSFFSFNVARFFGRGAVESILRGKLKAFDEKASQAGFKMVLFLRLTGVPPFLVANYAFGLSGIKVRHYLIGTLFGVLPWMVVVTYAAHSLWNAVLVGGEKGLAQAMFATMGPLMALSLIFVGSAAFVYWRKSRKEMSEPV